MLKVDGISKSFEGRRVLERVSFELAGGQTLLLLGLNGAGKTTLLSILAGMLKPDAGEVAIGGQSPYRTPQVKARIGYVTHQTMLHPGLTVRESLEWFAKMLEVSQPKERVENLGQQLGMISILDRRAGKLSRGEGQRASIARAMIADPSLLLLDEPFTGLDERGCEQLGEVLRTLSSPERSIIMTTHDTERGLSFATHVALLERGSLIGPVPRDGAPELLARFRQAV
ncbi:MAG: heme ABC exporter ATP-binding protein CcmA [Planctomycetaceae bacterium]|nr:heme ABC exporter ATP-binding protein CcmA [Planctomycetaceae bacterium]